MYVNTAYIEEGCNYESIVRESDTGAEYASLS